MEQTGFFTIDPSIPVYQQLVQEIEIAAPDGYEREKFSYVVSPDGNTIHYRIWYASVEEV